MEVPLLSSLTFYPRFCHITNQSLDTKSLANCKDVAQSWQERIDDKNLSRIQIVNIPTILKEGNTYLHIAAKTSQAERFEMILNGVRLKNPQNEWFLDRF